MGVTPVVITLATGYELLLELASEVNYSEYLIGFSSLGAFSKARVITGSCLRCFCSFGIVDVRVEGTTERAIGLLQVMTPKVPPLTAKMFLFFSLVAGIAWSFLDAMCISCGFENRDEWQRTSNGHAKFVNKKIL